LSSWTGEEGQALGWTGVEVFLDLREGVMGEVIGQQCQEGAAQEGEVGQEVGVTGTRAIFAHQGVAPPVVADFDAPPMTADEAQPLGRGVLVGGSAGEVEARFGGGEAGLFDGALAANDDEGAGKREVGRQRFDGEGIETAEFDASVAGFGLGKKGVLGRASRPRACWSSLG